MANSTALIDTVKEKSNKGIMVDLLPSFNISREAHGKAIAVNRMAGELCSTTEIRFVSPWNSFINKTELFMRDGDHLNDTGSLKLADIINLKLYEKLEKPNKQGNSKPTEIHPSYLTRWIVALTTERTQQATKTTAENVTGRVRRKYQITG
ncbi:hypothetical protein EQH57_0023 [Dictyocoela roeselum]|nr:hypothetical protein EQH57_0023 [Dictyocoela roeselum]